MVKRFIVFVAAMLLLCAAAGCAKADPQLGSMPQQDMAHDRWKIGVSFPMTDLLFRNAMMELLLDTYAADKNVRAQLIFCDGQNSQRKQNQDIMDLVAAGVDSILLVPYTTEGALAAVQYANEQKVPVLTLDNRLEGASDARVISFVGADHKQMGTQAAQLLLEALEERFPDEQQWNILEISGIPNTSGAMDRGTGIQERLAQEARIHVLAEYNAEFTSHRAKSVMADCLNVYPKIHAVICQNDLMAEGCYSALREAGMDGEVILIGIDGQHSVAQLIDQGGIDGTVIQYPTMALDAVELLCDYLDGEELETAYFSQTDVMTPENVKWYLEQGLPW